MSGRSRSTSRTVGANSTTRARAVAPVYATRASPYPDDCSNDARALAASTSPSTINTRGIPRRTPPAFCFLDCVEDCFDGCTLTTVYLLNGSSQNAGGVARFEALDLPLGFLVRDAIRLSNLGRKEARPPAKFQSIA